MQRRHPFHGMNVPPDNCVLRSAASTRVTVQAQPGGVSRAAQTRKERLSREPGMGQMMTNPLKTCELQPVGQPPEIAPSLGNTTLESPETLPRRPSQGYFSLQLLDARHSGQDGNGFFSSHHHRSEARSIAPLGAPPKPERRQRRCGVWGCLFWATETLRPSRKSTTLLPTVHQVSGRLRLVTLCNSRVLDVIAPSCPRPSWHSRKGGKI